MKINVEGGLSSPRSSTRQRIRTFVDGLKVAARVTTTLTI